jgi:hypothetical protein
MAFYNMQRLNPADRLGIHHAQPMQIYWGQNAAIFDRGDGWMTYFYTPRSSSFQAQFELVVLFAMIQSLRKII